MEDDLDRRIRFRAHELWKANGKPNGKSFWDKAEAEVAAERAKFLDGSSGFRGNDLAAPTTSQAPSRSVKAFPSEAFLGRSAR